MFHIVRTNTDCICKQKSTILRPPSSPRGLGGVVPPCPAPGDCVPASPGRADVLSVLCRMNDELRKLFSNLGSSYAKQLGFRDSWVFLGARDISNKSPFEQVGSWRLPFQGVRGRAWMDGQEGGGLGKTHRVVWGGPLGCHPPQRPGWPDGLTPEERGLDHFARIYVNS